MTHKDTYFIKVYDDDAPDVVGIGECNLFKGLGADDRPDYEDVLTHVCVSNMEYMPEYSSIIFGVETAMSDLANGGKHIIFRSDWMEGKYGIPINGLIWMGERDLMLQRIKEKIEDGFRCLKLKIGGIDFDDELALIRFIRNHFSQDELELRLDANGAFSASEALKKLEMLSSYGIHSIEQPIKAGQIKAMGDICRRSPIPIVLDEELIGVNDLDTKNHILDEVSPQYIILKPALCGGFKHSEQWIDCAESKGIGWWATSALESNIGLNAIAQWVASRGYNMPQGLGTGALYHNNICSPIYQHSDRLYYNPQNEWTAI